MSLSVLLALGLLGLFLYARGRAGERTAADPDAATLTELAAAGSDLTRDHEMEFFVYLPVRGAAEEVAQTMERQGFTVVIGRAGEEGDWLCTAQRLMRPDLETLRALRREFTQLAESRGGAYDGWGATVVDGDDAPPR